MSRIHSSNSSQSSFPIKNDLLQDQYNSPSGSLEAYLINLEMTKKLIESMANMNLKNSQDSKSLGSSTADIQMNVINETLTAMDPAHVPSLLKFCKEITTLNSQSRIEELLRRLAHGNLSPSERAKNVLNIFIEPKSISLSIK